MASGVDFGLAWKLPLRSRQVVHLLGNLSNLCVHRFLMGGHGIDRGGQLMDGLLKSLVGHSLGHYEVLHKTLQVRCRFRRWRGCSVGSSVVETRWLHGVLGMGVGIFVEGVRVTLPTLAVGGGKGLF